MSNPVLRRQTIIEKYGSFTPIGKKAAKTNKAKYGKDFYARIGKIGGSIGRTGGFYANRELASRAGKIGGTKSRRGPANV